MAGEDDPLLTRCSTNAAPRTQSASSDDSAGSWWVVGSGGDDGDEAVGLAAAGSTGLGAAASPTSAGPAPHRGHRHRRRLHDKHGVLSYSDALYGVIATILAATLVLSKAEVRDLDNADSADFRTALGNKVFEGLILLIVINIVYIYWLRSVRLFALVDRASALTVALHMTTIMLLGVLPLSASVAASTFVKTEAAPAFRALAGKMLLTNVLAIALTSLATTVSAIRFDHTLTGGFPVLALRQQERRVVIEASFHAVVLAVGFAADHVFNWVYLGYLALPLALAASEYASYTRMPEQHARYRRFVNAIGLGRLLQLSDGIYGVCATLIIIDIRIPDNVFEQGYRLDEFLLAAGPRIIGFALSFVVATLLWYQHRILMTHLAPQQSLAFHVVVLESLAVASFVPFAASLFVRFPDSGNAAFVVIAVAALASLLQVTAVAFSKLDPRQPITKPKIALELAAMLPLAACIAFGLLFISPVAAICALSLPVPSRMILVRVTTFIPRAAVSLFVSVRHRA